MGGRRACCLYKSFLQIPVPAGDISGAHRERAGTTLNFTCPVYLLQLLFGFAARTLNRRLLGTPSLLF